MKPIFLFFTAFLLLATTSCSKSSSPNSTSATLPNVQTGSVVNITDTTATLSGEVTTDGGATITTRGICWIVVDTTKATNPVPTPTDNNIVCDGTTGAYTANIKGLASSTKYNVRAYAINKEGVSYGQVVSFKTTGQAFAIPGVSITNLETDPSGNVYVTGTFKSDATSKSDIFVARFNPDGSLAWRKNIIADNYNYPHGGIVVANNILYVQLTINDEFGIGGGNAYVNAYDCQTGGLKWSTEMSPENNGSYLVVGGDGYIYASMGYLVAAIDPIIGKIVRSYTQGGIEPVAVTKDNIFAGGDKNSGIDGTDASLICEFDLNFNLIWSKISPTYSYLSGVQSILFFPNDSLLITGESFGGDVTNGALAILSIVCYKVQNNGANLIWEKTFNTSSYLIPVSLKTYDSNSFYVFCPGYYYQQTATISGPIEMDLKGNVLWTASPKKNGNIAVFSGRLFLADGSNNLKIYNP